MITADEELDLVDGNDVKIGVINRSQVSSLVVGGGRYVRAADVFIRNSRGEYWIPRRTADKRIAPGGLDFSMGEHVGAGESYLAAAIRGFREELNLDVSGEDLKLIAIIGRVQTCLILRHFIYTKPMKRQSITLGILQKRTGCSRRKSLNK